MSITANQLLDAISKAKSGEDLSKQFKATPDEVDAAFSALNEIFAPHLEKPTPGQGKTSAAAVSRPEVKPSVSLTPSERAVAERLIAGFKEHVRTGEIHFEQSQHELSLPFAMEKDIQKEGVSTQSKEAAVAAVSAAPCHWQWWYRTYWWGFRLSLNSCAVKIIVKGLGAASGIAWLLSELGIPGIVAAALAAVAGLLNLFDNGTGVRIYYTWNGISWITSANRLP